MRAYELNAAICKALGVETDGGDVARVTVEIVAGYVPRVTVRRFVNGGNSDVFTEESWTLRTWRPS